MSELKKIVALICCSFIIATGFAQQMDHVQEEPTDFMNANGKIYVVMAVVLVIVGGLFLYLIKLDRKIKKLEKNSPE